MTCNEHHIICKAVGDGWICTACETRYMLMREHEAKIEQWSAQLRDIDVLNPWRTAEKIDELLKDMGQ
jgi:hypothetical protein